VLQRSALHEAARRYAAAGWRIFPIEPRGKQPLVKWQEHQDRAPTIAEVDAWWSQWPDANIGLACGHGIVVLDFDGFTLDQARALLDRERVILAPDVPVVQTGKGWHVYVFVDRQVRNRANVYRVTPGEPAVDVRGDGGYVILPPSIHPSGRAYAWTSPWKVPLPPAPDTLYAWLDRTSRERARAEAQAPGGGQGGGGPRWIADAMRGVGSGMRNDTAARLAGYFLGKQMPVDVVLTVMESFARGCNPPLPLRELDTTVRSVARTRGRGEVEVDGQDPEDPIADDLATVLQKWREQQKRPDDFRIRTPLPSLTRLLNGRGWRPGTLTYIGARPGMGKSVLGVQIVKEAARLRKNALYVGLEMENVETVMRMIAAEGEIDADWLDGRSTGDEPDVVSAIQRLEAIPGKIRMFDRPLSTPTLARLVDIHAADIIVLDYLQLVTPPKERDRRLQIESISADLKNLAKLKRIPVIALSSLTRPTEPGKKPNLASLRESGQLEHDAHLIVFLHTPDDMMAAPIRPVEVIVAKNRGGRLGAFNCQFVGKNYLLREVSDYDDDDAAADTRYESAAAQAPIEAIPGDF
jgi:hypothetical protein